MGVCTCLGHSGGRAETRYTAFAQAHCFLLNALTFHLSFPSLYYGLWKADMGRRTGRLFVVFVIFLISFIAYSSQIFIIWPWYGGELSIDLLKLLVPFNIFVWMIWWNYYLCIVTDPGQVPKHWRPDTQGDDGYEVKKLTRGPRYCRNCASYKPPRSHHCSQCKRCVLRMDHHCPWINNCVGHHNYGHFLRFLFYIDIACTYHVTMVTRRVLYYTNSTYFDEPTASELIFIILNYTFSIPVLLAVGGFSIYHFFSLSGNSTTIEGFEKDKAATLVRRGKIKEIKFPYNLGVRRNINAVLGDNPWLWCWPQKATGTGLRYQLAEGHDPSTIDEDWPPKDPERRMMAEEDPNFTFKLPDSPWTYANGSLNPALRVGASSATSSAQVASSEAATHRRRRGVRMPVGAANVPPYHPDYGKTVEPESDSSWDDDEPSGSEDGEARTVNKRAVPQGVDDGYEYSRTESGLRQRRGSEGGGDVGTGQV
ncbi:Palmitoyltransferase [Steccherinum ochraceum]|uniref:Palmitoyltransferase PFA4 n=1 Tax=Steccherinum ochraceum TaxID=92696 RepID=A0A4R0RQL6_9APHY|nr:Palmitoyltransferase [Steccherinum ochraceum]